jgi:pilus assembly protein CpaC
MLKVRFGEIDRLKADKLSLIGIKTVDCLKKYGAFKVHAEPTLVVMSGEKAKFFSGGEMPIAVSDKKFKYKKYGIEVDFKPVVYQQYIKLEFESEITDFDSNLSGSMPTLPHFIKSKSKTTVNIKHGESFMISGIVKENQNIAHSNKTYNLFNRANSEPIINFTQKEMVLAITPYIVKPVKHEDIKLPTEDFELQQELQNLIKGELNIL